MTHTLTPPVAEPAKLLDVNQVGELLNCSPRHIYRLSDAGRMPKPLRLGSLVRWNRDVINDWIASGCPDCRKAGK